MRNNSHNYYFIGIHMPKGIHISIGLVEFIAVLNTCLKYCIGFLNPIKY